MRRPAFDRCDVASTKFAEVFGNAIAKVHETFVTRQRLGRQMLWQFDDTDPRLRLRMLRDDGSVDQKA